MQIMKAGIHNRRAQKMRVYSDHLSTPDGDVALTRDVVVRVEGAEMIEKRVTATRVALLGPLALLAKKPKGSVFVTVENGAGFFSLLEVEAKKRSDALRFAALANAEARRS
jgi:hypothetical protein